MGRSPEKQVAILVQINMTPVKAGVINTRAGSLTVEQRTHNPPVAGSNPVRPTRIKQPPATGGFFYGGPMGVGKEILGTLDQAFADALRRCGMCLKFIGWTGAGVPVHIVLIKREGK